MRNWKLGLLIRTQLKWVGAVQYLLSVPAASHKSAIGRYCSLIQFQVWVSSSPTIILAGPTVLSAVGVNPPQDAVR